MFYIGSHLSTSKGYKKMAEDALSISANTFQFFSRNPRGSKMKKLDTKDLESMIEIIEENNFGPILAHAPYTLNPCSAKENVREFANIVLKEDLKRLELFPKTYYNFHPGSHTGLGKEKAIDIIVAQLNDVIDKNQNTMVLLETMSGKGTEVGSTFEEIATIIEKTNYKDKIGVCMDTCHVHEAGYDIINNLDKVLEEFDNIIGLNYLYAIHLNDSKNKIGAAKDRHEKIGEGTLGLNTIAKIINHEKLRHLPFYLETPNELDGYGKEIKLLKSLRK